MSAEPYRPAIPVVWTEADVDAAAEAAMTGRLVDPEIMERLGPTPPHDYLAALYERIHQFVELETVLSDLPARLVGLLGVLGLGELSLDELTVQLAGMSDEDRVTCHWIGILDRDRATEYGRQVLHVAALMAIREH